MSGGQSPALFATGGIPSVTPARAKSSARLVTVGATAVLLCLLVLAPAAQAAWQQLSGSQCTVVGQTTCYQFYSSGNATGSPITDVNYQQIEESYLAYGDTVTGNTVPSDITQQETTWGSQVESSLPVDALEGGDAAVTGGAFDAIMTIGQWTAWSGMPQVALGTGAFLVGWKIGTAIANFLGIDSGPTESGSYPFTVTALVPVSAGTRLDTINYSSNYCGGWSGQGCTATGVLAPSDGWIARTGGNFTGVWSGPGCQQTLSNMPPGAEPLVTETWSGGYNWCTNTGTSGQTQVYFVPAKITAAPGQGTTQSTLVQSSPSNLPSEAAQLAGANSTLTNPAEDAFNKWACAAMGPSGPCPIATAVPKPTANETPAAYSSDLAQLGLQASTTVLPNDEAVWSDPAGAIEWTDPLPGQPVDPGSTVDIVTNPSPMPDPTQTGEKDYPECDLSNSNYVTGANQSPSGLTPVTDPSLVQSPTFSTTLGSTVLNYGWSLAVVDDPVDYEGYGYWHILAGHGWSLADDAATRTALDDPAPLPGKNANRIDSYEFLGPEYLGTGEVQCRRMVLVEFGPASGPLGIITSYGMKVTGLPLSQR
jgi:hypothetical protein